MNWKKKIFIPAAVMIALLDVIGSCCIYWSFHPQITITRSILDSDEEYHYERIMTIFTSKFDLPIAKPIRDELHALFDWCDSVDADLYENYTAPLRITVSGEVKEGKTTFWYEGYATTQDGETIDYREEKTFDCVFVSNEELLN